MNALGELAGHVVGKWVGKAAGVEELEQFASCECGRIDERDGVEGVDRTKGSCWGKLGVEIDD